MRDFTNFKEKPGDVFAFLTDCGKSHGLVQVVQIKTCLNHNHCPADPSSNPYLLPDIWVRVFYHPQKNLSIGNIQSVVNSKNFYYLYGFSYYELECGKSLGNFPIPDFVQIPRYMRFDERGASGKLVWHIFEMRDYFDTVQYDKNGKRNYGGPRVVKTYKQWDEILRPLSPSNPWGLELIKDCWEGGFTLEAWDSESEEESYLGYLKECEPHKLQAYLNPSFKTAQKKRPTKEWKKSLKEGNPISAVSLPAIKQMDIAFDKFIKALGVEKVTMSIAESAVRQCITDLNVIEKEYECIETIERDEILDYMQLVLSSLNLEDAMDIADKLRKW